MRFRTRVRQEQMRTVAIIQARMASERLPGKVLKLIGKWPAIYHTYQRVNSTGLPTVVATVKSEANEPLIHYLNTQDISCFAWDGPEDDVLGRYHAAAEKFDADRIVRITGDCPFTDPDVVKRVVGFGGDYASNIYPRRTYPRGLDVEVFTRQMLEDAHQQSKDREHVTPWMQQDGAVCVVNDRDLSDYRWVLDTPADLEWFRQIAKHMSTEPPHPTFQELLDFLNKNPDMARYE